MPKEKDYDKKIVRLMTMLNKLNGGSRILSGESAKEFNVTIRTIQRDIDLLCQTGFPVDMVRKGEYAFMEGFSLKKVMLTNEEASLLSFFHEMADSLGENFSKSFRGLLNKILPKEDESPFYVKWPETHACMKSFPFFGELESAVRECRKISLSYETEKGNQVFKLCPLKLINFEGFWYLLAMPDGKRQFWKFRPEKINALETLNDYFDPPENIKTVLGRSVNIWFGADPGEKIILEIGKSAAHYFKKKIYFPEQRIVKETKDGSLIVESRANFNEVLRTIIHWIPDIRVISPKGLDTKIRRLLKEYLNGKKSDLPIRRNLTGKKNIRKSIGGISGRRSNACMTVRH
jgi:predicted DNA-binding transcriptional regulator YafY